MEPRPRKLLACLVLAVSAAVASPAAAAESAPRLREEHAVAERRLEAELARLSPEAVPVFRDASARLEAGDASGAEPLFEQVIRLAPAFVGAERRLCMTELDLGRGARARSLCERALERQPSAENHAALAMVLARGTPSKDDLRRAEHHARRAAQLAPDQAYTHLVLCQVALAVKDGALLRSASRDLLRLAPEDAPTHVMRTFALASDGDLDGADAALAKARALGLDDARHAKLESALADARPLLPKVLRAAGILVGGWFALFGLLFALGTLLSHAALRSAARLPSSADGRARGLEGLVRRAYRAVLWAAGAFYYVSLPLVAVVVVGAVVGAVWGIVSLGYIPVKGIAILGLLGLGTLGAILRALLVRVVDEDPGERLDLRDNPRLRAVLDEVAARIGTRPVDEVYLTPFSDVAVLERGGFAKKLRGSSERALVLGAGVIEGMNVRAFKSVLAHEYGHFHNEDTAGGGFALAARRSMLAMAIGLARSGSASNLNPAWWFVRGYYAVFLRISQGASRLQEVLADRWAAFAYGAAAFEAGMRHVVQRSIAFDAHVDHTLGEVVEEKRALANLYAYAPKVVVAEADLEKAFDEVWNAAPSPYDSHPRPSDRVAWVEALGAAGAPESSEDAEEVWALFRDRRAIELAMTDIVRARVVLATGTRIDG